MKQYIKNKPFKLAFKYWYRCDSETSYVYPLELYQGQKEKGELNLGSSVVLDLCQVCEATQKPSGRNNIYIECAKKIKGLFI